jgi:hypothetical protein
VNVILYGLPVCSPTSCLIESFVPLKLATPFPILHPVPKVQSLLVAKSPFTINSGPISSKLPFCTNSSLSICTFFISPSFVTRVAADPLVKEKSAFVAGEVVVSVYGVALYPFFN